MKFQTPSRSDTIPVYLCIHKFLSFVIFLEPYTLGSYILGTHLGVLSIVFELLNSSSLEEKCPSILKIADIKPIHKSCSKYLLNNYRATSLLSTFSTIFEE